MSEEIKVGDRVEVYKCDAETLVSDVGIVGIVKDIHKFPSRCVILDKASMNRQSEGNNYFALCDVRKVAPVPTPIVASSSADRALTDTLDLVNTFKARAEAFQKSKRGMDRAAMLRTSMELTRALAKLRRG